MSGEPRVRAEVRAIMAKVFAVTEESLPPQATVDAVGAWDSLAHLALIEALSAHFKVAIPVRDAVGLLSEDDLVHYLSERAVQA